MNGYTNDPKIKWLIDEFHLRKQSNPSYSLRAFARKLNLSPSFLSQLFMGKKDLSDETRQRIIEVLNLEREYVEKINTHLLIHQRRVEGIKGVVERLTSTYQDDDSKRRQIDVDNYLEIIDWIHDAVFHAIRLGEQGSTLQEIAEQLDFAPEALGPALSRLLQKKLIIEKDGRYFREYCQYSFFGDVGTSQLEQLKNGFLQNHYNVLNRIGELYKQPYPYSLNFTSHMLRVPRSQINALHLMIQEFGRQVDEYFNHSKVVEDDDYVLCCFNSQSISLERPREEDRWFDTEE